MSDLLLLETGTDYLTQEDGGKIVLVFFAPPPAPPAVIKKKSGWMPWYEEKKKRDPYKPVLIEPNLIIKKKEWQYEK